MARWIITKQEHGFAKFYLQHPNSSELRGFGQASLLAHKFDQFSDAETEAYRWADEVGDDELKIELLEDAA